MLWMNYQITIQIVVAIDTEDDKKSSYFILTLKM